MILDGNELDQLTCDILLYLHDQPGRVDTSELKQAMDVDRARKIKYRIREYLGNLVREYDRGTDADGRHLPHEFELTDEGEAFVSKFRDDLEPDQDEDIEHRLERIERRQDRIARAVRSLQQAGDA